MASVGAIHGAKMHSWLLGAIEENKNSRRCDMTHDAEVPASVAEVPAPVAEVPAFVETQVTGKNQASGTEIQTVTETTAIQTIDIETTVATLAEVETNSEVETHSKVAIVATQTTGEIQTTVETQSEVATKITSVTPDTSTSAKAHPDTVTETTVDTQIAAVAPIQDNTPAEATSTETATPTNNVIPITTQAQSEATTPAEADTSLPVDHQTTPLVNHTRKLASIRRITSVTYLPDGTAIARVDGWTVKTEQCAEIITNGLGLLLEVDSFLPCSVFDDSFKDVGPLTEFDGEMGYRVATYKVRVFGKNRVIQGYLFRLSDFPAVQERLEAFEEENEEMTEEEMLVEVREWELDGELGIKKWVSDEAREVLVESEDEEEKQIVEARKDTAEKKLSPLEEIKALMRKIRQQAHDQTDAETNKVENVTVKDMTEQSDERDPAQPIVRTPLPMQSMTPTPTGPIASDHTKPPAFVPRTDMERSQNCPNLFMSAKYRNYVFQETRKLDGSTISIYFVKNNTPGTTLPNLPLVNSTNPADTLVRHAVHPNGRLGVCSQRLDIMPHLLMPASARTQRIYWTAVINSGLTRILPLLNRNIVIQAELVGSSIQNNPHNYPEGEHELVVFSMAEFTHGSPNCRSSQPPRRIHPRQVEKFAAEFGLKHVPVVGYHTLWSIADSHDGLMRRAEKDSGEGLVFKNVTTGQWFKVLSEEYIIKFGDEMRARAAQGGKKKRKGKGKEVEGAWLMDIDEKYRIKEGDQAETVVEKAAIEQETASKPMAKKVSLEQVIAQQHAKAMEKLDVEQAVKVDTETKDFGGDSVKAEQAANKTSIEQAIEQAIKQAIEKVTENITDTTTNTSAASETSESVETIDTVETVEVTETTQATEGIENIKVVAKTAETSITAEAMARKLTTGIVQEENKTLNTGKVTISTKKQSSGINKVKDTGAIKAISSKNQATNNFVTGPLVLTPHAPPTTAEALASRIASDPVLRAELANALGPHYISLVDHRRPEALRPGFNPPVCSKTAQGKPIDTKTDNNKVIPKAANRDPTKGLHYRNNERYCPKNYTVYVTRVAQETLSLLNSQRDLIRSKPTQPTQATQPIQPHPNWPNSKNNSEAIYGTPPQITHPDGSISIGNFFWQQGPKQIAEMRRIADNMQEEMAKDPLLRAWQRDWETRWYGRVVTQDLPGAGPYSDEGGEVEEGGESGGEEEEQQDSGFHEIIALPMDAESPREEDTESVQDVVMIDEEPMDIEAEAQKEDSSAVGNTQTAQPAVTSQLWSNQALIDWLGAEGFGL